MKKLIMDKLETFQCPSCEYYSEILSRELVDSHDDGWENGNNVICTECGSEVYVYNEDGKIVAEEV